MLVGAGFSHLRKGYRWVEVFLNAQRTLGGSNVVVVVE